MYNQLLRTLAIKNPSKHTTTSLRHALQAAQEYLKKPLESATKEDILSYIEYLRKSEMAESTIALRKSKLRQFYNFCYDETDDIKYRKLAKLLQGTIPQRALNPQDILIAEDIKRMINATTIERDRCLIASFFESGVRVNEFTALNLGMVIMKEDTQEVIYNIPNIKGCKTGARSILCLEIHGYVQDWMKCHPDSGNPDAKFIELTDSSIAEVFSKVAKRAHIKKPVNPHMFRHAAITHAVSIGMQESAIKQRFWGNLDTSMLSTYITLNEQIEAQAYRNAKGMNGDSTKVINPLASRCVECGRLIQAGSLCVTCHASKTLKAENVELKDEIKKQQEQNDFIIRALKDKGIL